MMETIKFHITVKAIVIYNHKVLILKKIKPSTDGLGYWELPGGGLEYGETPHEALIRELKEETNLDIKILKPIYTFTAIRPDYQTVGIGFLTIPTDDNVIISDEHTEFKFVDHVDLKNYLNSKIYDDVILALEEYKNMKLGEE